MQVRSLAQRCAVSTPDPLALIRRSTARLHTAIERDTPLARLAAHDCTVEEYRRALRLSAAIYATLDRQFVAAEHWRPRAVGAYRLRSPALLADLHRAGESSAGLATSGRPIDSTPAYLGARYVVDGAQFGHRVIAAALAGSPAAPLAARAEFWSAAFVSRNDWRRLRVGLSGLHSRDEVARAARSARRTFEHFYQALDDPGRGPV